MRYEKTKRVTVLQENEVNNMICPMCREGEQHQETVQSDGITKTKCKGCGTIFYNPGMR